MEISLKGVMVQPICIAPLVFIAPEHGAQEAHDDAAPVFIYEFWEACSRKGKAETVCLP